jgi:hypothetical protein
MSIPAAVAAIQSARSSHVLNALLDAHGDSFAIRYAVLRHAPALDGGLLARCIAPGGVGAGFLAQRFDRMSATGGAIERWALAQITNPRVWVDSQVTENAVWVLQMWGIQGQLPRDGLTHRTLTEALRAHAGADGAQHRRQTMNVLLGIHGLTEADLLTYAALPDLHQAAQVAILAHAHATVAVVRAILRHEVDGGVGEAVLARPDWLADRTVRVRLAPWAVRTELNRPVDALVAVASPAERRRLLRRIAAWSPDMGLALLERLTPTLRADIRPVDLLPLLRAEEARVRARAVTLVAVVASPPPARPRAPSLGARRPERTRGR